MSHATSCSFLRQVAQVEHVQLFATCCKKLQLVIAALYALLHVADLIVAGSLMNDSCRSRAHAIISLIISFSRLI